MHRRLLLSLLLLAPAAAGAETPVVAAPAPEPTAPPRNFGNLRIGASTGNSNDRPELCLEVAPVSWLSVESCGTGAGILHRDPAPEVAHFRSNVVLFSRRTPFGLIQPLLSLGFAELQVGEDAPGFRFRDTGPVGNETAGPEAAAGLRTLVPVAGGFELVGKLELGVAWLPHAPELYAPAAAVMPWGGISLGAGF